MLPGVVLERLVDADPSVRSNAVHVCAHCVSYHTSYSTAIHITYCNSFVQSDSYAEYEAFIIPDNHSHSPTIAFTFFAAISRSYVHA